MEIKDTTTLIENQQKLLEQEKQLLKLLTEYNKNLEIVKSQLINEQEEGGNVELYKTESPLLVVESFKHQSELHDLFRSIYFSYREIREHMQSAFKF